MELREGEEQLEDLHTLTCFYLAQACLYLTSPQLTSTSAHLTSPHLASPRLASPHLTSPHLTCRASTRHRPTATSARVTAPQPTVTPR